MEQLHSRSSFIKLKQGNVLVNENTVSKGDSWEILIPIQIPKSLVKSYFKKVKDETGNNLSESHGEINVAEELVSYAMKTFIKIENLPTSIVLGDHDSSIVQVQPQAQTQAQPQTQPIQDAPTDGTTPQGDTAPANPQAQAAAQSIPATEGGTQVQAQATATPTPQAI